jgi:hypothetical protein
MQQGLASVGLIGLALLVSACSTETGAERDRGPGAGDGDASSTGGTLAETGGAAGVGGSVDLASGGTSSGAVAFCTSGDAPRLDVVTPEPYELPPEAAPSPEIPAGQLTEIVSYPSELYGDVFPYRVYVPAPGAMDVPLGLMVFQDGGLYLDQFKASAVLDHLIAAGEIPRVVALFVDAPPGGEPRRVEVYDNPSDLYARFLTEELVPDVILGQYNVTEDPGGWATVGFSAGGTQAMLALLYKGEFFQKSLQTNSSFLAAKANGLDMTTLVSTVAPGTSFKVSLLSGENDLSDHRGEWIAGNLEMAGVLDSAGHQVRMVEGTGTHYPPLQGIEDFPNALRWLWSGCTVQ